MARRISALALICLLALAAGLCAAVGCSSRGTSGNPGSSGPQGAGGSGAVGAVSAQLTLQGGEHVSTVQYTLSNASRTYSGTENVSSTVTGSFVIGTIVADTGYTLSLTGMSDDQTVRCSGSVGTFSIQNRTTTAVSLNLQCVVVAGLDGGSVLFTALTTNCPVWNSIVASPLNITLDAGANVDDSGTAGSTAIFPGVTPVPAVIGDGQSLVLIGAATAPDPGSLTFTWTANGGTISSLNGTIDPNSNDAGTSNQTIFTCPATPGTFTIKLSLADGPVPDGGGCEPAFTTGTVTVNCQAPAASCSFGTGCGDGGQVCNLAGACVPALFSVVVLNSIDGGVIDSKTTTLPVSIQKFGLTGPVGAPIALPTANAAPQAEVTFMGSFTAEGDLTTSADGRYLSMLGWQTPPGGPQAGFPVIARIAADGSVDTSTVVSNAFQPGPVSYRSVVSKDGAEFWISGTSNDNSTSAPGGIWYVPFGASSATQLAQFPNASNAAVDPLATNGGWGVSARWLRIFGGQLYAGTDYAPPYLVSVGTGLPTTGTPPVATLPGGFQTLTSPLPSPYGFVMFNLNNSSGFDTMYVADDGMNSLSSDTLDPPSSGDGTDTGNGGLSKWTFSSGSGWTKVWTLTAGTFPADAGAQASKPIGFRGLAAYATGTTVTLMATTANVTGNPDSLAVVMQDSAGSVSPPPMNVIATTPVSQVFRGVALTPQ